MEQTRVFVSSTCYDLKQERANLERAIRETGHTPLLSDHGGFPVAPDLDAIANCRKVVEGSDVLLLIVGGRRGSLDPSTGKPVVSLEYDAAIQAGLPVFAFVHRPVWDLLPVWERNPDADFLPHVDYPQVFQFVQSLQAREWVFPFGEAEDIISELKVQLSVLLSELLEARERLGFDSRFRDETEAAQILIRDRPQYWEYKLTSELLHSRLDPLNEQFRQLARGTLFYRAASVRQTTECCKWIEQRCRHLVDIFRTLLPLMNEDLIEAWGAPGEDGDPEAIVSVADRLALLGQELFEWEVEAKRTTFPPKLASVHERMCGWAAAYWQQLLGLPVFLDEIVSETAPKGVHAFDPIFEAPAGAEELVAEIGRIMEQERHG